MINGRKATPENNHCELEGLSDNTIMSKKVSTLLRNHQLVPTQIIRRRSWLGAGIIAIVFIIIVAQLFNLQYVEADKLQSQANRQRTIVELLLAARGSIVDRNGQVLATTEDARSLTFQPVIVRQQLVKENLKSTHPVDIQAYLQEMSDAISHVLPQVSSDELLAKMNSMESFVYLIKGVSPSIAQSLQDRYPYIGAEVTPVRVYPAKSVAGNIIGITRSDGPGLEGLELILDAKLAGSNGSRTYDRGEDGTYIPGSDRDYYPQKDGDKVELTIDGDLQHYVQTKLDDAVRVTGARSAEAVVLEAKTGHIMSIANNATFDPSRGTEGLAHRLMLDPAIQGSFEPGSVNKIIAASGIIDYHLASPNEVLHVPGSITMGSITVRDAWPHGIIPLTVTGVFGKSSNVGTLMLTKRLGPERYYDLARKFGIGQRTGVELSGESSGYIPPIPQWSGATFANLPIGQGLSTTLLQMTSLYQAIANDGVRMPPRVIHAIVKNDNSVEEIPEPVGVRVVSAETARTVRRMFESVVQDDPTGLQRGTAVSAAVKGYQISGKTGTAQQVDKRTGRYSENNYNITFAGIAPGDNPRFVIGIFLDNPHRAPDGSQSQTAGPLFHDIANWVLNKYQVPLSKKPAPRQILIKNT